MKRIKKENNFPLSDKIIFAIEQATKTIDSQARLIAILEEYNELLKKENELLKKENDELSSNKGIHSIELMFEAFVIQQIREVEKRKIKRFRRLTDAEALLHANKKLNIYPEKFLIHSGNLETKEFGKIITSYTKNYKGKFKKEFGYLIQNFYIRGWLKNDKPKTSNLD